MRLLITGGLGYLGGRLAQYFIRQKGYAIRLGSRSKVGSPPWLPEAEVVQTQWSSSVELEEICADIDAVLHLAGMNAQESAEDPTGALEFNGVTTARLLQAAIKKRVKRFIYFSTAHVYGSPLAGIITEDTYPLNLHPYAISHRVGEDVVRYRHHVGEIEGVVIRLSNACGPPAHKEANCWMLLVNDLCRQAVCTRKMILNTSGIQLRDFINIRNINKAVEHLLLLSANMCGDGLFNLGGECARSVLDMTKLIATRCYQILGFKPEVVLPEPGIKDSNAMLEYRIEKLKATGFKLNMNIEQEIDDTLLFCKRELAQEY